MLTSLFFFLLGYTFVLHPLHAQNAEDTLTVMTYNLLNFPNGGSCGGTISIPNRVDTLKKILDYIKPDVLMVCELNSSSGADQILNSALNHSGTTKYKKANFVANRSSSYKDLNNMFYYNSEKLVLDRQGEVLTGTRDVGKYVTYIDGSGQASGDTIFLTFMETHLKAGSKDYDKNQRGDDANVLKQHIDNNNERSIILGGDFNLYSSSEQAYYNLTRSGGNELNDPVQREGYWSSTYDFRDVHTQSTRSGADIECGAYGGLDDRFDFLLVSDTFINNSNQVHYVTGSYQAVGNNGSTYNKSINDVSNSASVPDDILSALYYMSDHLPVVMKLAYSYPLGVSESENQSNRINIYPNPAKDKVNVETGINMRSDLFLYDALGNEIEHFVFTRNTQFRLENLAKGMYWLKVENKNFSAFRKLIKY